MKKIIKGSSQKDKVLVVLEKMQDSIGVIAEGQQMLRGEMSRRFNEVDEKFNEIDQRFDGVDQKFNEIDQRFDGVDQRFNEIDQRFSGIESNLKTVLDYLYRIDEDISQIKAEIKEMKKKEKINENWMASIEKRIGVIEKQLKIQRQMAG